MKTTVEEESFALLLEKIGQKLCDLRLKKGYNSQADFAADYNLPSVQYWRMERGKANITLKSLHRILLIHGMTMEQMFRDISHETHLENHQKRVS